MNVLFQKLGFQEILEELQQLVKMQYTKDSYLQSLKIHHDYEAVNKSLSETEEALKVIETGVSLVDKDFSALTHVFEKVNTSGLVLFEPDLKMISDLLSTIDVILFAVQRNQSLVFLNKLLATYDFPRALHDRLTYFILPTGELNLDANPELKRITKEINTIAASIRERANSILKTQIEKGKAASDAQPTIINGRIVLPVFSEYKRQIEGLIHDESASGQTTYLEPSALLHLNNELRELEIEERRIKYLIYKELTDQVSKYLRYLQDTLERVAEFDFIIAKAKLAKRISAVKPQLEAKEAIIHVVDARNPNLLLLADFTEIIPFDLLLTAKRRVLVLSGPNAGGKSVLLKSVGLIQLMLQCGLLVPVDKSSRFSLFNNIVADIGDDQSVEDELSTYTAHMSRMAKLLKSADSNTLFLLDEFGAGTDPESGGKIAAEILIQLLQANSFGVVSTHYEEVKQIGSEKGASSGAMQFDTVSMKPLFVLKTGQPGRSFAFEVAQNVGVPVSVLEKAKARFSKAKIAYDEKLKELNAKEVDLELNARQIKKQKEELDQLQRQYRELVSFYQESKKNLLEKAKGEVAELLKNTKSKLDKIAQNNYEFGSESLKTAKQEVQAISSRFKVEVVDGFNTSSEPLKEVKIGQKVQLIGSDNVGEVLSFSGQMVDVLVGELKIRVKKHALALPNKKASEQKKYSRNHHISIEKREDFQSIVDIRGMSGQEANELLQRYLDDVLVLSIHEIKIIHGRGTGVLRKLVRELLKKNKFVKEVRDEHADSGGDGATIASFV